MVTVRVLMQFDPFGTAGGDDNARGGSGGAGLQHPPSGAGSSADSDKPNAPKSFPPATSDPAHPTDKGAREQAATTAPEGTEKAQRQKSMRNADNTTMYG